VSLWDIGFRGDEIGVVGDEEICSKMMSLHEKLSVPTCRRLLSKWWFRVTLPFSRRLEGIDHRQLLACVPGNFPFRPTYRLENKRNPGFGTSRGNFLVVCAAQMGRLCVRKLG
jgi:hypothetical protein